FVAPNFFQQVFSAFTWFINAGQGDTSTTLHYSSPRGWSIITLIKCAVLGFYMVFGDTMYPFQLFPVLPGMILVLVLAVLGSYRLLKKNSYFELYLIYIVAGGGVLIVYEILDPLLPPDFINSPGMRHLIWVLPLFLWLLAEGIATI